MTEKNTADPPKGNGFLWTLLLVITVSTVAGLMFWKFMKGSNHPRPRGEKINNTSTGGQASADVQDPDGSIFAAASPEDPTKKAPWFDPAGPGLGAVPEFLYTGEDGLPFGSGQLKDKVWILDFIFTSCQGPCPAMSAEVGRLRDDLKDAADVHFVSFTVDPVKDTPEVLSKYASGYGGTQGRWHLLTGPRSEVFTLAKGTFKVGADLLDPNDPTNILHSTRFFLVDRNLVIRGRYASEDPAQMQQLRADAKLLASKK